MQQKMPKGLEKYRMTETCFFFDYKHSLANKNVHNNKRFSRIFYPSFLLLLL